MNKKEKVQKLANLEFLAESIMILVNFMQVDCMRIFPRRRKSSM